MSSWGGESGAGSRRAGGRGRGTPIERQGISRAKRILIFFFFAGLLFISCAKAPAPKRPPPKPEPPKPVAPMPAPPKEEVTPRREASQKMIQMGEEYMGKGQFDKAIRTFQEAINIDPSHGVAYYFLSKSLYFTQSYDEALGLLDKAESLLSAYPQWLEEVVVLKGQLEAAKLDQEERQEMEKKQYY